GQVSIRRHCRHGIGPRPFSKLDEIRVNRKANFRRPFERDRALIRLILDLVFHLETWVLPWAKDRFGSEFLDRRWNVSSAHIAAQRGCHVWKHLTGRYALEYQPVLCPGAKLSA